MPESWIDLGLMSGSPPEPDKVVDHANYDAAPYLRWAFLHMREVLPTARVARGDCVAPMPRADRDLAAFMFTTAGRDWTLAEMMEETYVDGLMVVHDGEVVFAHYGAGMTPETTHICQSVSKSLTATLAGVLWGQGRLDVARPVPDYIGELAGTCWDGCTIQHLLDMTAGVSFDESDYENADSECARGFRILGWSPRRPDDPLPAEYIAAMTRQAEHGAAFEYRSILTDVLGWCIERATGEHLAEVFSREVWAPMGAAQDADFLIGPGGFPLADGGFCVTLEDLARFGLMHLQGGRIDGKQVVPAAWVQRLRVSDPGLVAAYAAAEGPAAEPGAFYHDQWWVRDAEAGIYAGLGIHGQSVLIHHPSRTVVACFSTWPRPTSDAYSELASAGLLALCESLA
jgi:CubicO group peptidase (beta-lactamase class C family)